MRWLASSAAMLLLTVIMVHATGAARQRSPHGALWKVDLSSCSRSDPVAVGPLQADLNKYPTEPGYSVRFIDNKTLAATFIVRKRVPTLTHRKQPGASSPLWLQAVFLHAATGKIQETPKWPTTSDASAIVAGFDGKFVTQRDNTLTLFLPGLRSIQSLTLPALSGAERQAHTSPSGRNILFTSDERERNPWVWVDATQLRILHTWENIETGETAISDGKMALSGCLPNTHKCGVLVEAPHQPPVRIISGP